MGVPWLFLGDPPRTAERGPFLGLIPFVDLLFSTRDAGTSTLCQFGLVVWGGSQNGKPPRIPQTTNPSYL